MRLNNTLAIQQTDLSRQVRGEREIARVRPSVCPFVRARVGRLATRVRRSDDESGQYVSKPTRARPTAMSHIPPLSQWQRANSSLRNNRETWRGIDVAKRQEAVTSTQYCALFKTVLVCWVYGTLPRRTGELSQVFAVFAGLVHSCLVLGGIIFRYRTFCFSQPTDTYPLPSAYSDLTFAVKLS